MGLLPRLESQFVAPGAQLRHQGVCRQSCHALMLTLPPHLMRRPLSFIVENGACAANVATFDKRITRVETDKEDRWGAYDKAPVQAEPRHAQAKRWRDEPWPQVPGAGAASSGGGGREAAALTPNPGAS